MTNLYLISTPIGNRKDITIRALETIFSMDFLYCEDTRRTKQLLDFYLENLGKVPYNELFNINLEKMPQLLSFFEHNEEGRISQIVSQINSGANVGVVTNAGTPTISDPGFKLVKFCRNQQIPVISIPGPVALISALSISGLSADKFTFLSFLPRKDGKQLKLWQEFNQNLNQTIIFYESPFRIKKTLINIKNVFGNIEITICRELTKLHEEVKTDFIENWLKFLEKPIKGELVVLFRLGE